MKQPELGLALKITEGPHRIIEKAHSLGFTTCQIGMNDASYYTEDVLNVLRQESEKYGVSINMLGTGPPGHVVYDFIHGPQTIGLVPLETRASRAEIMMQGADWAAKLGIKKVHAHLGFVPVDRTSASYRSLIPVLREIARHCQNNGQDFYWETGPETPVTLLRTLEDTGETNVRINFDPANLLMYGMANPLDALELLGPHVGGVHIKDGEYPTDANALGNETTVGEGQVDFPALFKTLRLYDYDGPLIIECEFEEDRQVAAIKVARKRVETWLKS